LARTSCLLCADAVYSQRGVCWLLIVLQCVCDIAAKIMRCDTRCFPRFLLILHRVQVVFFPTGGSKHVFSTCSFIAARSCSKSKRERRKHAGLSSIAVAGFFSLGSKCKHHQKMLCDAFSIETEMFCLLMVLVWHYFYQIEKHSVLIKFCTLEKTLNSKGLIRFSLAIC
jgi:hypothetical protein